MIGASMSSAFKRKGLDLFILEPVLLAGTKLLKNVRMKDSRP